MPSSSSPEKTIFLSTIRASLALTDNLPPVPPPYLPPSPQTKPPAPVAKKGAQANAPTPQIIDTSNMQILVGPRGISPGDELTFFYPSTEWRMAQPFDCACGAADGVCRRRIAGAEDMSAGELAGYWLSGHVRALKAEQARQAGQENGETNGVA